MKLNDLNIGDVFSCNDDGLYKLIYKTSDELSGIILEYSYTHEIALPKMIDNDFFKSINYTLVSDVNIINIFDELYYNKASDCFKS